MPAAPSDIVDGPVTLATLRDAAMAHLKGAALTFDAARARSALSALDLSDHDRTTPAFYETDICLVLASHKPGKQAQKSLYRLFKQRMAAGETDAFEQFQGKLVELEKTGVDLGGLQLVDYFGNIDHADVWAAVDDVLRRVETLIGPVFLNSGTLLGVVRERALLPHDDDVDLAVVLDAQNAVQAAQAWARAYHLLHAEGLLAKKVKRNHGVFQLKSSSSVKIDLFPAWIEEGRGWIYPYSAGALTSEHLLPLAVCPYHGLPIPRDSGAVLASNYGDGWRIPDPGYAFSWNKANKEFESFRNALVSDMAVWEI